MSRDDTRYKLDELAAAAGVPVRTVRYYVQRGLLPPPVFRGRDTSYDEGHLARLSLIKRLQDERFLPLDAIAAELVGLDDAAIAKELRRGERRQAGRAEAHRSVEQWARVVVADGVELHVRVGAAHDVDRLVVELRRARSTHP